MSVSAALPTFSRMNSTAISVWRPFVSLRPAILDRDSAVLDPAGLTRLTDKNGDPTRPG
jgi:hypothetical protein